jgi:hypothetical protein
MSFDLPLRLGFGRGRGFVMHSGVVCVSLPYQAPTCVLRRAYVRAYAKNFA